MSGAFTIRGDVARLAVRLTPRARRDSLCGIVDGGDGRRALAVRVTAPPVDGAANRALLALLAARLSVAKSAVTLESGDTSRLKIVRIAGVSRAGLEALIGA
jgi:uncharacterized protein (TIGR00251 family)